MFDLLLPRTDAGVAVQAVVVLVAGGLAVRKAWHRLEWRVFVIGAWLLTLAVLGVRAVH